MGSVTTVFTIVLSLLYASATFRHSPWIYRVISFESYDGIVTELTEATIVQIRNNHGGEIRRILMTTYNLNILSSLKKSKGEIFSYKSTEIQESR